MNHAYQELGDYRVVLTVSDGYLTDEDIFTVHIIEAPTNLPPVPVITVATTIVMVDEVLELDGGTNTMDPEDDDLQFDWDFDDADGVDDWVRGPAVTHSWDKAGKYTVTLRVTDGVSTVDTTKTIDVKAPEPENLIPSAYAGADVVLKKGDSWTFLGTGTDSDGTVVAYEWDLDGNGIFDTYSESNGNLNHVFTDEGYRTLRFRVTDDRGGMGFDTVTVTVLDPSGDNNSTPAVPSFIVIMIICLAAILAKRGKIRGTGSGTGTEKEELSFK
ncbi:MAG: PKD domain-containing protein [Gammaproteobacteria bacterium]|nr:PKD domain-containing protein [Gammaproteobacteria bacterium]